MPCGATHEMSRLEMEVNRIMRALWAMTKMCALFLILCKSLKVFKEENDVICLILGALCKMDGLRQKMKAGSQRGSYCKRHQRDDGGLAWW